MVVALAGVWLPQINLLLMLQGSILLPTGTLQNCLNLVQPCPYPEQANRVLLHCLKVVAVIGRIAQKILIGEIVEGFEDLPAMDPNCDLSEVFQALVAVQRGR